MRNIGYILISVGLIAMIYAINMDVSVSTYGGRVNNIGLISDRQNYLIFSGVIFLAGVILSIFGSKSESTSGSDGVRCKHCAESIKPDAVICRFCGREVDKTTTSDESGNLTSTNKKENKANNYYVDDGESSSFGIYFGIIAAVLLLGGLVLAAFL
ncbi:hypothetical protein [Morganella morganii]|uniref:hypothetical protein n=1 Tax=Morganella morganii TaxID=582 RepID=UPI0006882F2E|nr:hypothetical protein [Morganella morganii]